MALTDIIIDEAVGTEVETISEFTQFAQNLPEDVVDTLVARNTEFITLVADTGVKLQSLQTDLDTVKQYLTTIDQVIDVMTRSSEVLTELKDIVKVEATKQGIKW